MPRGAQDKVAMHREHVRRKLEAVQASRPPLPFNRNYQLNIIIYINYQLNIIIYQ